MSDPLTKPFPWPEEPAPNEEDRVKSKERATLFPDEPAGFPADKAEDVVVTEEGRVRIKTKGDDRQNDTRTRRRDNFIHVGRITLRVDGEDVNDNLHSCNECKALVLRHDREEHSGWHERMKGRAWQNASA